MEWRNRPNLNDTRAGLAAVVCHDNVYAIGGNNDNNYTVWDTVESIQVSSLLETMETLTARQNNSQWARLQCHLLSAGVGCATVIVQNCYVIILCGNTCVHYDTPQQQWRTNNNGRMHEFVMIFFCCSCDGQFCGGWICQ